MIKSNSDSLPHSSKLKGLKKIIEFYSDPKYSEYSPYFQGMVNGLISAYNIISSECPKDYLLPPEKGWKENRSLPSQEKRERSLKSLPNIKDFM